MRGDLHPTRRVAERAASPAVRIECCPECEGPAEVEWADRVGSTDGPLELVKLRCLNRHWFLMRAGALHRH